MHFVKLSSRKDKAIYTPKISEKVLSYHALNNRSYLICILFSVNLIDEWWHFIVVLISNYLITKQADSSRSILSIYIFSTCECQFMFTVTFLLAVFFLVIHEDYLNNKYISSGRQTDGNKKYS